MARNIKRAAVLGAGVMGTGIATHLKAAGLDVILLDIVPPKFTDAHKAAGLTEDSKDFRNAFAAGALKKALKSKPPTYHDNLDAKLIEVGNFDDDLHRIADCDWVIEVIIENVAIKQSLYAKLEEHRKPGTLVTSNTSGLKIEELVAGRSDDFKKNFFVTHFFNPVRFMRLLELVSGTDTDPSAVEDVARLGADVLGKGIVFGKDTVNFIANRIGVYGMMYLLHAVEREGFTVEEVDALFGQPMGRPKSAVFRTADIVGLDTLVHVANNCYENLTDDECRDTFKVPGFIHQMVENEWLGQKTKQGFYKKQGKEILALNLKTLEYAPKEKIRADSIGAVRKVDDVGERVGKLLSHDDKFAKLAWECTAQTLIYAARRIGEIADDVLNIDRGMRWGFNWDLGPFELWDALGVEETVKRMQESGYEVPGNVLSMLQNGAKSFYGGSVTEPTYYDFASNGYKAIDVDSRHIKLDVLRSQEKTIQKNSGSTLFDLGDGVLGVEFHTKMNAINPDIISGLSDALDLAEKDGWHGIVVGNDDQQAFSAGADIFMMLVAAGQKKWDDIDKMVNGLQQVTYRMRWGGVPVVTAPAGLALGGGAEVAMASDLVRAHVETYIGLVEVGVGLIPAGGGCLMLLDHFCSGLPDEPTFDALPFIQRAFQNIAMAKVAVGADDARKLGYFRAHDQVSFNRDLLLHDAKQALLGLAKSGYRAPRPPRFRLPGNNGSTAFKWFVDGMLKGAQITEHESLIASKLANVLCGGDTSSRAHVTGQQILDLEREAFLSLLGEEKTRARMQHMLQKGKPLRN